MTLDFWPWDFRNQWEELKFLHQVSLIIVVEISDLFRWPLPLHDGKFVVVWQVSEDEGGVKSWWRGDSQKSWPLETFKAMSKLNGRTISHKKITCNDEKHMSVIQGQHVWLTGEIVIGMSWAILRKTPSWITELERHFVLHLCWYLVIGSRLLSSLQQTYALNFSRVKSDNKSFQEMFPCQCSDSLLARAGQFERYTPSLQWTAWPFLISLLHKQQNWPYNSELRMSFAAKCRWSGLWNLQTSRNIPETTSSLNQIRTFAQSMAASIVVILLNSSVCVQLGCL